MKTGQIDAEALTNNRHDFRFDLTEFRKKLLQRFNHITQVGFGRIVEEGGKLLLLFHERHHDEAVLSD